MILFDNDSHIFLILKLTKFFLPLHHRPDLEPDFVDFETGKLFFMGILIKVFLCRCLFCG